MLPVLAVAVLFPGTRADARSPATRFKPSLYASLGLIPSLYGRKARLLRWGALGSLVLVLAAYLIQSPVGSNAERLALLWGLPVLLAYSPLPALVSRRHCGAIGVVAGAQPRPGAASSSTDPSASRSFYAPLISELAQDGGTAPGGSRWSIRARTGRPPTSPRSSRLPAAGNARSMTRSIPIFYGRSPLDAPSYQGFLETTTRSAGWPFLMCNWTSRATAEARLIRSGLPYLTPLWHGGSWTLYAVTATRLRWCRDRCTPSSVGTVQRRALTAPSRAGACRSASSCTGHAGSARATAACAARVTGPTCKAAHEGPVKLSFSLLPAQGSCAT